MRRKRFDWFDPKPERRRIVYLTEDAIRLREYFQTKLFHRLVFYEDIHRTEPVLTGMAWVGRHCLKLTYKQIAVALCVSSPAVASRLVREADAWAGKMLAYREYLEANCPRAGSGGSS
jgi:hypothetical protein